MRLLFKILDPASSLTLVIGCAATLLMLLHVSLDVLARLVIQYQIGGTLETVTYIYMVAVVFLPLAMVQRRRQQIIVEIFSEMLPKRVLALLDGIVAVIGCVFMLALTWFSAHEAWAATLIQETAPSTQNAVPIWPARWMVVVGAGLVALYLALQAAADLTLAATGRRAAFDEDSGQHVIRDI